MKGKLSINAINTLDMPLKGSYSFDITIEIEKKRVKFNFVYEVR